MNITNNTYLKIIIFILINVISYNFCFSNQFYPLKINTNNYPKIEFEGIFLDNNNQLIKNSNIKITENNGQVENLIITNTNNQDNFQKNDVLFLIDLSNSNYNKFNNIIKPTLSDFFKKFDFDKSEFAVVGFNNNLFLLQDFTNNAQNLIQSLDNTEFFGSNDFENLFFNKNFNLTNIINSSRNRLSIILISSGSELGNENLIISELNKYNLRFHSITLDFLPSVFIDKICSATMGFSKYANNLESFKNSLFGLAYFEKFNNNLKVEYNSFTCSLNNNINIEFSDFNYNYILNYELKKSKLPFLLIEPPYYDYGIVSQAGENHTFKITAKNGNINISGFENTQRFKVISEPKSFTLLNGQSRDITIRYEPIDSNYIFNEIKINSNSCENPKIYLSGGSDKASSIDKNLKIIKPNGGEFLAANSQYLIEWRGVLPSDTVQIDFSTNNGSSWQNITNSATGLKYLWKNIPQTASSNCLLKISHFSKYDSKKNIISLKGLQGNIVNMFWKNSNNELYTASTDGFIRIWNAQTGEPIKTISNKISNLNNFSINYNFQYFAYLTNNKNKIFIKSIDNEFEEYIIELANEKINNIEWNKKNNFLAASTENGNIYIWNFPNQTPITKLENDISISSFKWDFSGERLAVGYENGIIRIWKSDGTMEQEIKAYDQKINSLDFNPTSKVLVSSSMNELIKVWDIATNTNVISFLNDDKPVNVVSWDPLARYISSASIDSSVILWNPADGNKFYTFKGHNNFVNRIIWREDGEKIASSTVQGEVLIWSVKDIPFSRILLQEDVSESNWNIVNPNIKTKNIIFPYLIVGHNRDTIINQVIYNNSNVDIVLDSIFLKNSSKSFKIINKLPEFPFILVRNSGLDLKIKFSPQSENNKIDTLIFFTGSKEYHSNLMGFVDKPMIEIEPKEFDFGNVRIGDSSNDLKVRIKNLSESQIFIEKINEVYNSNSQFEIKDFTAKFIDANEYYDFSIVFKPNQLFVSSACFDVIYDGKMDYDIINLIGASAAPQILVKNKIEFNHLVCEKSLSDTIRFYNKGNDTLRVKSIKIISQNRDNFDFDFNNTKFDLNINDSSNFILTFSPKYAGVFTDTLEIETNINSDKSTKNYILVQSQKDFSNFTLSSEYLPFYLYDKNTKEEKTIYIYNKGSIPIKWSSEIDFEKFKIKSIVPQITQIGDSSLVTIEFKGANDFGLYKQYHIFEDSCSNKILFTMSAYIGPNLAQIECDSIVDFPEIICDKNKISYKYKIKNIGETPLFISKFHIKNSSSPYNFENNFQNISIPKGENYELIISFFPEMIGAYTDTIQIFSNANNVENGTKNIVLNGAWNNTEFSISPKFLTFENILDKEIFHNHFEIINTGNMDLVWNDFPKFNFFEIDSISSKRIKPKEKAIVYFTFLGGNYNKSYSENLIFNNLCNSSDSISISVIVNGNAQIAIKTGKFIGKPGDTLEIPIIIYSIDGNKFPKSYIFNTNFSFNSTIMVPIDENKGYVNKGERRINYTINSESYLDSIVMNPRFLITLGNSDSTILNFNNTFAISDNTIRILEIDGLLILDSISTENGLKLVGNSGLLRLYQNAPNPADEFTKIKFSIIENGLHQIILYDLLGYTTQIIFEGNISAGDYEVSINTSHLPIGNYIYRLISPSQQLLRKLTITR